MFISLVDNAIKHGLADGAKGEIALATVSDGAVLQISVAESGSGFSTGVCLSNIRQRLEAIYGNRVRLEVGTPPHGGFVATIILPLEEKACLTRC